MSKRDIPKRIPTTENGEVYVYVDKETGVNYIIFDDVYKGGICPRYNADGSLYIEGVKWKAENLVYTEVCAVKYIN